MSQSKTKSNSQQQSTSTQQDNKINADGGAIALSGSSSGNVIDRSFSDARSYTDASKFTDSRSYTDASSFSDSRSTSYTDNSVNNSTDLGLFETAFSYFQNKDALNAAATNRIIDSAAAGLDSIYSAGASVINDSAAAAAGLLTEAGKASNPSGQQSRLELMLLAVAALFIFMKYKGAH